MQVPHNWAADPECLRRIAGSLREWGVRGATSVAYGNFDHLERLIQEHGLNVHLYGPGRNQRIFLDSKILQNACADAVGLDRLPTWIIGCDESHSPDDITYPAAARPDRNQDFEPDFKADFLADSHDLARLIGSFQRRDGAIVIQPFRKLPNLVLHGSRSTEGVHGQMAGFLVERKLEGVSLTLRPIDVAQGLREKCRSFVEQAEICGPYHFEFLLDSDKTYFIDFNGRLGGTTAKVCRLGFDEPLSLLESYGHIPGGTFRGDRVNAGTAVNRMALAKAIVRQIRGTFSQIDYLPHSGAPSLWDLLKGFVVWSDDILDPADPSGSFTYYRQTFLGN